MVEQWCVSGSNVAVASGTSTDLKTDGEAAQSLSHHHPVLQVPQDRDQTCGFRPVHRTSDLFLCFALTSSCEYCSVVLTPPPSSLWTPQIAR